MGRLGVLSTVLLVAAICLVVLLLAELTSNTATAATFLPVLGGVAWGDLGEHAQRFELGVVGQRPQASGADRRNESSPAATRGRARLGTWTV